MPVEFTSTNRIGVSRFRLSSVWDCVAIDILHGMSDHSLESINVGGDASRLQMERAIDHLADLARSNIESGQFFAAVLNSILQPGGAARAVLWKFSEDRWQLAGQLPNESVIDSELVDKRQSLLNTVSTDQRPRIVDHVSLNGQSNGNSTGDHFSQVLIAIRHAGQTVGILEAICRSAATGQHPSESIHFFTMVCEIAADFLAQNELKQLRQFKVAWNRWDQYSQSLWQSLDLRSVCATVANDGRLLAECDRISVVTRHSNVYRLMSVSGVESIEPRATATRLLESIAKSVTILGRAVWWDETSKDVNRDLNQSEIDLLHRYLLESKSTSLGVVPIAGLSSENGGSTFVAVLIFDQFNAISDPAGWKSRCESLAFRSRPVMSAAVERDEIPWLKWWQRAKHFSRWRSLRPYVIALGIVAVISAALVLIPSDFTISGSAELWPAVRRDVFASSSGMVDQILVSHGTEVRAGQPLIVLRDPELETEIPRVTGEIATIGERLKGVQAARLTSGTTGEAVAKLRQLTADEEELKERLRTLERQRSLIDERSAALTLRSPVAGKILTWDTEQHLSARPVERGQSLLTVGDTNGPWVVEVRIADKNVGHLLRARKQTDRELGVDFMLASDPGRVVRGHVRDISLSSELDENSRSQVRVIVDFDSAQIEHPRPGATVLPRIHCGTKPLGYVWLHDLIDAIRTRVLF